MLNPELLKCYEDLTLETSVQQGKTMDNKLYICENINIFGYMGGGGRFNNQTCFPDILSPIYMYMSNKEAI